MPANLVDEDGIEAFRSWYRRHTGKMLTRANAQKAIAAFLNASPAAAEIERLRADVASLETENEQERMSTAELFAKAFDAEACCDKLAEALKQLAADATQVMAKHDPHGAEIGNMPRDEAARRVNDFIFDAAPFVESIPARARVAMEQVGKR